MTAAEEHQAERCRATHEAIKAGRTALMPVGTMKLLPDGPPLILFNCPHCDSTISCREAPR